MSIITQTQTQIITNHWQIYEILAFPHIYIT